MRGLYVITRPLPGGGEALATAVEATLQGGARLVQYRDKGADYARRVEEVRALLAVCRAHDVPLIVNDDVALAAETGADGVHLGKDDSDVPAARERLGARALIGASCYNELERALAAERRGASYVAFGSFYPSPTKPEAVCAEPALLTEARARLSVPICAIGGITPANGGALIRAGADLLAVLSGVFDAEDKTTAAAAFARLFGTGKA